MSSFDITQVRYFLHHSTIKDIVLLTDLDLLVLEKGYTNIKKLGYRDWSWVGSKLAESLFKRIIWDLHNLPVNFTYKILGEKAKDGIEDKYQYFTLKLEKIEGKDFLNIYDKKQQSIDDKEINDIELYKETKESSGDSLDLTGYNLIYTILPKAYFVKKLKNKPKENEYIKDYKVFLHKRDISTYNNKDKKKEDTLLNSLYTKYWVDYIDMLSLEFYFLTKKSIYTYIKTFMSFWYKELSLKGIRFVEPNSNFNLNIYKNNSYLRDVDKWQRNRLQKEETQELQLLLAKIKNTKHLRNNIKVKVEDKIKNRRDHIKSNFPYLLLK